MAAPSIDVDLFTDPLTGDALHETMRRARDAGPVVRVRFAGQEALLVTRFDVLRAFLAAQETFPGEVIYQFTTRPNIGATLIDQAEPDHTVQRQLAMPAFRSRAVARFVDDQLTPLAHEVLERMDARSSEDGSCDLAADLAQVLPFWSISRKLGLPIGSEERQRAWALALLSFPSDPDGALRAAAEVTDFLLPTLAERRSAAADDVISGLLHAEHRGERFDDEQVAAHVRLLYSVGATTTSDAMSTLLWRVASDVDLWARCRDDPAAIPAVIHESLRCEPPVSTLPRLAPDGGEVGGVELPPMALVLCGIAAANRDPSRFADADAFDPDRAEQEILTFGFGAKFCPGSHLARQQLAAGLGALVERFERAELLDVRAPTSAVLRRVEQLPVRLR